MKRIYLPPRLDPPPEPLGMATLVLVVALMLLLAWLQYHGTKMPLWY